MSIFREGKGWTQEINQIWNVACIDFLSYFRVIRMQQLSAWVGPIDLVPQTSYILGTMIMYIWPFNYINVTLFHLISLDNRHIKIEMKFI